MILVIIWLTLLRWHSSAITFRASSNFVFSSYLLDYSFRRTTIIFPLLYYFCFLSRRIKSYAFCLSKYYPLICSNLADYSTTYLTAYLPYYPLSIFS